MKKILKAALLTTVITFAGFANAGGHQTIDICEVDESVFVNQVGGFAVGTAFTASVAAVLNSSLRELRVHREAKDS